MPLKLGQRYVCTNPLCRAEIEVTRASTEGLGNPRCACGAEMKKPYTTPIFRRLDNRPAAFGFVEKKKRAGWPRSILVC